LFAGKLQLRLFELEVDQGQRLHGVVEADGPPCSDSNARFAVSMISSTPTGSLALGFRAMAPV
jgi:hypothetical protein